MIHQLKKTGVYRIVNRISGRCYVGSAARTFQDRFRRHRNDLRANRHGNRYLQSAWNLYGEKAFEFEIIEECPPAECVNREQHYLDHYFASQSGVYNHCITAGSQLGNTQTEESNEKRRKKLKGVKRSKEQVAIMVKAHTGAKRSEEAVKHMIEAGKRPEVRAKRTKGCKNREVARRLARLSKE